MSYSKKQSGFAALEGLLIFVVLAIISFVGYKVLNTKSAVDQVDESISSSQSSNVTTSKDVPVVNSADDLNKAEQSLNKENPDDSAGDSGQLDSQLAAF